jgi:UDP-GlcNAc:undecaprenyl-phosphate GlcNAc-1-phosphate transferase
MLVLIVAAVVGSFGLSWVATGLVRTWALRRGFVDRPGGHKGHTAPVALGGGIALVVAICAPILGGTALAALLSPDSSYPWLPAIIQTHLRGIASKLPAVLAMAGGVLVLHIVGLVDDRRPLGAVPKFIAQFAVAAVIAGPVGIRAVQALPAPVSIVLTILWIVLITNAFNFLDNMDGLSCGVALIASAIFALAAMRAGQVFVPILACVMVGALLGFLVYNFAPASIFMGDAGSLPLGFLMSVLTILTTFYDPALQLKPVGVVVPIVVLAVPLYDVVTVVMHRLRAGESPLRGDRRHFSHRLVKRGLSSRGAVLTIYLATLATGLPAIVLPHVDWLVAILLLTQCLSVVTMVGILEHTRA